MGSDIGEGRVRFGKIAAIGQSTLTGDISFILNELKYEYFNNMTNSYVVSSSSNEAFALSLSSLVLIKCFDTFTIMEQLHIPRTYDFLSLFS